MTKRFILTKFYNIRDNQRRITLDGGKDSEDL